ncbi:MAG: hypothetical protein ACI4PX_02995, partial [Ruminococcus sp.]
TNIEWCRKKVKKCRKIYNIAGKFFLLSNIIAILLDLAMMILHPSPFLYFLNFIIKGVAFYFGISGSVHHDSKFCSIALILCMISENIELAKINYFLMFYPIFSFVSIIGMIIIIFNNRIYKKLEKAEGFPYFNERLEKQKENMQNFIANDYQAYSYDDFHEKCSNNFKMDDI